MRKNGSVSGGRMASGETAARVSALLESYRAAFERLDAPAIAGHFAYPGHVTSDAGEIALMPVAAEPEWGGAIERLLGMYRAIGFSSARVLDVETTELSPRLVQAVVHWALHDGAGHALYDFEAAYTLAEVDGTLRIAAIAHNEIPRYRACLARIREGRSPGARGEPPA